VRSDEAAGTASVTNVDMKVEVVVIPLPTSGGQRSSTSALDSGLTARRLASSSSRPTPRRVRSSSARRSLGRATFSDPDGNVWLLQEITTRLPGRMEAEATSFGSASDLASAFRRAAAAHGEHENRTGETDPNWPDWYAAYMVAEQAGTELPIEASSSRCS